MCWMCCDKLERERERLAHFQNSEIHEVFFCRMTSFGVVGGWCLYSLSMCLWEGEWEKAQQLKFCLPENSENKFVCTFVRIVLPASFRIWNHWATPITHRIRLFAILCVWRQSSVTLIPPSIKLALCICVCVVSSSDSVRLSSPNRCNSYGVCVFICFFGFLRGFLPSQFVCAVIHLVLV